MLQTLNTMGYQYMDIFDLMKLMSWKLLILASRMRMRERLNFLCFLNLFKLYYIYRIKTSYLVIPFIHCYVIFI